jgi:hypothetical protein
MDKFALYFNNYLRLLLTYCNLLYHVLGFNYFITYFYCAICASIYIIIIFCLKVTTTNIVDSR